MIKPFPKTRLCLLGRRALFLAVVGLMAGGCATLKKKFSGSSSVNMAPFAENTLLLLSELDYGLRTEEYAVVEKYIDMTDPDLVELRALVDIQRTFLKGIMAYSVKVVNLNRSGMDDKSQAKEYGDYLKGLVEWFVQTGQDRGSPTPTEYKGVLAKIEKSSDLLAGLRAAQPLIVRFNGINLALGKEIAQVKERVVKKILGRLDQSYVKTLALNAAVHSEKERIAGDLRIALEKSKTSVLQEKTRSYREAQALSREVSVDVNQYLELKKKIGALVKEHDDMIRRGGKTIYLWTNAHQKMADGVQNPAEWFPLTDIKALVGAAGGAVL